MTTTQLHLETLFVLDAAGRIVSTRVPEATPGPLFALVRSAEHCAWAVRADVSPDVAAELNTLARAEPPVSDLRGAPAYEHRYQELLADLGESVWSGPAFRFPSVMTPPSGVVFVEDERSLSRHFRGWREGEIAAGCAPMMAIVEGGHPVSICFSSRWSPIAAEAGVETAEAFRGRGLGLRVVTAWALAVRDLGRIPMYSTSWSNSASLALARKLNLEAYATDWSIRAY